MVIILLSLSLDIFMLNPQWLTTFLTLVELGHFTQTANKLFMTQPGVSQHIKKLEQQVGTLLLNRVGKRFELTSAGAALYEFGCKRREQEMQFIHQIQIDDPHAGYCRFGFSGAIATLLYPQFLAHQARYPRLSIAIEAAPNKRIVTGILENSFDIGIVTHKTELAELTYQALGDEPLCLVLPAHFKGEQLTLEGLNSLGFIDHPDGEYYLQQIMQANFDLRNPATQNIRKSGYINQLSQILLPVSQGLGFTVLPQSVVKNFNYPDALYLPTLDTPVRESLFLMYKTHKPLASRYQALIQIVRDAFPVP